MSYEKGAKIVQMLKDGYTYQQIADELRVSKTAISTVKKELLGIDRQIQNGTGTVSVPKHTILKVREKFTKDDKWVIKNIMIRALRSRVVHADENEIVAKFLENF